MIFILFLLGTERCRKSNGLAVAAQQVTDSWHYVMGSRTPSEAVGLAPEVRTSGVHADETPQLSEFDSVHR